MGIYFPDDVVRDAFLGREWALEASKALGIDIGTVPEVRIARMNVDDAAVGRLAEENADRLLSEIRTAKSEDTAGLFAKYSEFRLFHVNERNRTKRNELDGAISDYLLISAHRRENVTGRDEPSVF